MTIRVRFMINQNEPLRKVRFSYTRSSTSAARRWGYATDDGWATIDRDDRRRGIRVTVMASNPVLDVHTGPLFTRVDRAYRVRDGDTVVVPRDRDDLQFYRLAQRSQTIYENVFKPFSSFGEDNPFGRNGPTARPRIQLRYPARLLPQSFCDPHPRGRWFPTIYIVRNRVTQPNGAFDRAELSRHLTSELSHALHFGHCTTARRAEIRLRYAGALLGDATRDLVQGEGLTAGWQAGEDLSPIMAFCEALDIWGNFFRNSDTSFAARLAGYDAAITARRNTLFADPAIRGDSIPNSVFAALYGDFATTPGIGIDRMIDMVMQSNACTFAQFRRRISRRFGPRSMEARALVAAAQTWDLL